MKARFFSSASAFRQWLEANHASCDVLEVGFYQKKSGKPSITYPEALDECLCFGWIDGVRHKIADDAYTVRFTPRKTKSKWSAVNIAKVRKLTEAGRMAKAGLAAFEGAQDQSRAYSFEQRNASKFSPTAEKQFRARAKAWAFFQTVPPWYQRTTTFWVVSAKKEETQQSRLLQLIASCAKCQPIPGLEGKLPVPKRNKPK